jgi:glucose/mannose-6-phosphate isomerase
VSHEQEQAAVLALPDHLRDALWKIEMAQPAPSEEAPMAIVAGMGGSAIGGDLASAALGDRLTKPMVSARGYALPPWAAAGAAILCSSYSGETEETLALYAAAGALAARRLVATTGGALAELARRDGVPVIGLPAGLQPRAAVGYMFTVAAELAALAGAAPRIHAEIEAAAAQLEARESALLGRAESLADELEGTIPVVCGADLTAPVAYRWKGEINENAKLPAFSSTLPEASHIEISGWGEASRDARLSCILLADADQHPRVRRRLELTSELVEPHAAAVITVEAEGESRPARLLELVMLGDLISLDLARRAGVDPTPIPMIDALKSELGPP